MDIWAGDKPAKSEKKTEAAVKKPGKSSRGKRWDPPSTETPALARGRVDTPVTRLRRAARVGRVSPI